MNKKINASSLYYALFLSVVMGIIAGTSVLLSGATSNLLLRLETEENLGDLVHSGIEYGLTNFESLPLSQSTSVQLFEDDVDSVKILMKKWGAFYLISASAQHGNLSRHQTVLAGQTAEEDLFNFYLSDLGRPVSVCGETSLEGKIAVPESGFKRAYIEGKNFTGNAYYSGSKVNSNRNLPPYNPEILDYTFHDATIQIWNNEEDSVRVSFLEKPIHFISDHTISLNEIYLDGQIIIESDDSIFVGSNAQLQFVILKSPIIHFEEGFTGTVQCLASEKITIEKNCRLLYPSVLGLVETEFPEEENHSITIGEKSQVMGTVYCISTAPNFRKPVAFKMSELSEFDGLAYCTGRTQFQGTIKGFLYTEKLHLETKSSTYENYLLDAQLKNTLPKEFIVAPLFQSQQSLEILTCVY